MTVVVFLIGAVQLFSLLTTTAFVAGIPDGSVALHCVDGVWCSLGSTIVMHCVDCFSSLLRHFLMIRLPRDTFNWRKEEAQFVYSC